ncbi:ATP-dependent DNA ligase [Nocardioides sp. TRM66260-LWL]|uniref:ATP-dependent DNA ligase n=1 Tax=Nocardioides sp. TRM66260-LWL TaxID=2874478 RepID=UPI001CC7A734|nr:ATP-dependent DNA ligase [Nocardioides sp. TRM66260-LWL]MBZ5733662.1 ATP-dependent DNA ligase [Nocardioides sp. TRM66260-LWL]
MLLADLAACSAGLAATRSRTAKVALLAPVLAEAAAEGEETLAIVTSYLGGALRQRRTGLGWRSMTALPAPAAEATLTVAETDAAFAAMAALAGPGSAAMRSAAVESLFGRATEVEQPWLRSLALGEVRQGALDALVQEALARAGDVPLAAVRRAAMLAGSTVAIAPLAFAGEDALAAVGLTVGRPVLPMLASSDTSVASAVAALVDRDGGPVSVDAKLDGIRIQVHRDGDDVRIASRSLEDLTARLPDVVDVVRALPARRVVLDGEALTLADDGRPRPFQDTASRTSRRSGGTELVVPWFFDLLHLDDVDLLDAPAADRLAALEALVPEAHRVRRLVTDDPDAAEAFAAQVVADGHEGVVVKSLTAPYEAGRRGAAWVKVKPVHTLDLVVLAVEWGSGRRKGLLSNIHLGARDPQGGPPVMVGKTFKGMTDEMLAWQTERFLALQTHHEGHVVHVRPEQVVEIALDGVQRSTRYPGGVALRFARVVRYRDDKTAQQADTIDAVRALG